MVAGIARAAYYSPVSNTATLCASASSGSIYHTEGPIYDGAGNILFCELSSQHTNDTIWTYNIANKTYGVTVGNSGGTQGDYFNSSGQLITADRDTRQVSRRSLSNLSSATAIASTYGGKPFNGPNDLVVDSAGGIYFTDPNFENFANNQGVDAVYYITSAGAVSRAITYASDRPNGIILSPDQKTLYVGLWNDNDIMAYTINSAGVPTNGRTFLASVTRPDGITIDPWGDLMVARTGGVSCYSPSGSKIFDVTTADSGATNVELGGADGKTLFITAGTSLYSVSLNQVPEPTSLGILLVSGVAILLCRRRKTR